jgi:hypothetical protein
VPAALTARNAPAAHDSVACTQGFMRKGREGLGIRAVSPRFARLGTARRGLRANSSGAQHRPHAIARPRTPCGARRADVRAGARATDTPNAMHHGDLRQTTADHDGPRPPLQATALPQADRASPRTHDSR